MGRKGVTSITVSPDQDAVKLKYKDTAYYNVE